MNTAGEQQMNEYMAELRRNLSGMTIDEQEEILREIGAHIRDCVEQSEGASAGEIVARLGSPAELAREYSDGALLRAASRSFSPLLLLQATLRIATKGIAGAAIFVVAMIGYSLGGGLILTALLKPFLPPALTGLWIGPHAFGFGIGAYALDHPGVHEVLGVWYIPAALALGGITLHVTTLTIRKLLRVFAHAQSGRNAYWSGNADVSVSI